jgi:hypothetical protein
MNSASIIRYLLFLLQTRDLQWSYVRVRVSEIGARRPVRRARLNSKY